MSGGLGADASSPAIHLSGSAAVAPLVVTCSSNGGGQTEQIPCTPS